MMWAPTVSKTTVVVVVVGLGVPQKNACDEKGGHTPAAFCATAVSDFRGQAKFWWLEDRAGSKLISAQLVCRPFTGK